AGQRNGDDLGDQVRGLHPLDLVDAGRQAGADLVDRAGDDLDVEDRHEAAQGHGPEAQPGAAAGGAGRILVQRAVADGDSVVHRSAAHAAQRSLTVAVAGGAGCCVSTVATTDMPGRSLPRSGSSASSAIFTGTRCTILVKLPVAFCGGSSENSAPEAGARLSTWPRRWAPGKASTRMLTGWPMFMCVSCVSL